MTEILQTHGKVETGFPTLILDCNLLDAITLNRVFVIQDRIQELESQCVVAYYIRLNPVWPPEKF